MTTDEQLLEVRQSFSERCRQAAEADELSVDEHDAARARIEDILQRYYAGKIDADMAADAIDDLEDEVF